jgi:hypothetical protein
MKIAPQVLPDRYLGDGVYASYDGYGIALDLRGQSATDPTRIYLEPAVMRELRKFAADAEALRARREAQALAAERAEEAS